MRRIAIIFCVLGTVSMLAACNKDSVSGGSASADGASTSAAQAISENGADSSVTEEEYPEHEAIRSYRVVYVPGTRHIGDGWRIYIPDTWLPAEAEDDCWQSDEDSRVTLQVAMLKGITDCTIEEYLMESFAAYDLRPTGNDAYISLADGENLMVQTEGVISESYCCILERWPDDAAEGLGSLLGAISDTFSRISDS